MEKALEGCIVIMMIMALVSCKVNYSFTGASIPPDAKTVNIQYFQNNATLVEPTLSQKLTDAIRERFTAQTSLIPVETGGDLVLEGFISDYRTDPLSIQSNDLSAQNRLTITVKVKFSNLRDEKMNYETSFSRYADYSSTQNLADIQETLTADIIIQLTDDIFNKAVVNW